ncbi:hypothetical protein PR202_gb21659 [Eleusine coracana subsp. coracana]|uniref:Uncharacterized protein n=1 Tax=Eleusine coracana subsp. coracana TaxID=191504 RepID=A0AAV5FDQ8_ELECO|nr:hypothetical protein PR202_gb21659 [Eleusine coracana subsp. coracana]
MEADAPLDYALFQLSPRRQRCELVVSGNGRTEKIASGSVKPFVAHLRAAEEQASAQPPPPAIRLQLERRAPWFSKGTLERFVRFVSTPEVLEMANTFDLEMSQLEGARKIYAQGGAGDATSCGPAEVTASAAAADITKKELLRAIDVRLSALKQDLATACSRASSAGFNPNSVSELLLFATHFGANRLSEACTKFMSLCQRRPDISPQNAAPVVSPHWKGFDDGNVRGSSSSDMSIDEPQVDFGGSSDKSTVGGSDSQVHRLGKSQGSLPAASEPVTEQKPKPTMQQAVDKQEPETDASPAPAVGGLVRRLSVKDRISMFESQKKEQTPTSGNSNSGGASKVVPGKGEHRRVPSGASMEKLVRRWSSVSDMSIDLSNNDSGNLNEKKEDGIFIGTPTSTDLEGNSKLRADKDCSGLTDSVTSQSWSCQKDDMPVGSTSTNTCSPSISNDTPTPHKQTKSHAEDGMVVDTSITSESSFGKEQGGVHGCDTKARVTRPAKGNQDRHGELQMKANELEKLYAAHKLTSSRRGKSTDVQVDNTPMVNEVKPVPVLPEKIYTKKIVKESITTNDFDAKELLKMVNNQGYDSVPQNFGILSLEESRGKFYDQYMQKRDAKLKEDWKLQREEKEAMLKAMHESLERSKAELQAKFSRSLDVSDSAYVYRSQKIPPLQSTRKNKDQGVDSFLVEEELNSDYLSGDGSSRSADSRKHFSRKVVSAQKASAPPVHKRSSRTVSSGYSNRKNPPENPLAQSVPNFSDFRKENTRPAPGLSRGTARGQHKSFARSKSIIEESKSILKEDQSRRSQSMRKSLIPDDLKGISSVNEDIYNWAPMGTVVILRIPLMMPKKKMKKEEEYESLEENLRESDFPADSESENPRGSHDFGNSDDPGSENGDVNFPGEAPDVVNAKFGAFAGNMHDSTGDLPAPWSSRLPQLFPYANDNSDGDAFADSPSGSPSPWNSHSLDEITDADVSRMRKKWGSAQMPFVAANASQHSRKDASKGLKKLWKFGRKNRGGDDWVSASTASEYEDDMDDGRDLVVGTSDDYRKSRMGYLASYDEFVENESFSEQEQALRSSIPNPPANFRLREDQLTGSSLKDM